MAALATMELANIELGVRLGLYEALAQHGPRDAGPSSPRRRERSSGTSASGSSSRQSPASSRSTTRADLRATRRFALPNAHAHVLLDDDSESCMKPCAAVAPWVGKSVEIMTEEFRRGTGVAFGAFDLHDLQAAFTRPVFRQHLVQNWLPALTDVQAKLSAGRPVRIAEIGCGTGVAALTIAEAYPNAQVDGFDLDDASIGVAQEAAAAPRLGRPGALRGTRCGRPDHHRWLRPCHGHRDGP